MFLVENETRNQNGTKTMTSIKASDRNRINDVVSWIGKNSGTEYVGTVVAIREGKRPSGLFGTQVIVDTQEGTRSFYEEEVDFYNDGKYDAECHRDYRGRIQLSVCPV
jgi:hypothetical protein